MSCEKVFLDRLHERGFRLTPQREMVLSVMHEIEGFATAEEIYSRVQELSSSVDISTVYRTLELLKELDLVTENDLGEGRVRYHVAEKGHHHHLVCRKCGGVMDLDEATLYPLKDVLLHSFGFEADLRHLAISGECSECRKKRE